MHDIERLTLALVVAAAVAPRSAAKSLGTFAVRWRPRRNDALGRAAYVRHDEADAGIKFSGMPLDLGDNPPRLGPGSGLIAQIGMEPARMVRRSSDWAREQI